MQPRYIINNVRLNSTTLGSLRYFEAAARFSSFSRAGTEVSLTQGAVNHQIKYKDCLGCKPFYRFPDQVESTEKGKQFVGSWRAHCGRSTDRGCRCGVHLLEIDV